MNYLNILFYVFILIYMGLYFLIPNNFRYLIILLGSYIFYGFSNPVFLVFLLITTIITYCGGYLLEKKTSRKILVFFFILNLVPLFIFKYTNFAIQNFNFLSEHLLKTKFLIEKQNIIMPIGLSFYIFQSCTYLTDVYKKKIPAERNILLYAAFVSYFPTILSGPIQKARELLPQIRKPHAFSSTEAKKGTILFIWGLFEKTLVSNNLQLIVEKIYSDYKSYNAIYFLITAICFSLYIYADFSAYSDMARGLSKIMGIEIRKNFKNPYLSETTAEFWNRWHVSLNSWFIENIYIPLGGSRKGAIRRYINIFIVFFISGLWHGANWHYVAWGVINGILVIIGHILRPIRTKLYKHFNINTEVESIRFIKRVTVFSMISLTWIFFQNDLKKSLYILKSITKFKFINLFDNNLFSIAGSVSATFVVTVATIMFCIIQCKRQNETLYFTKFERQPYLLQCGLLAIIIVACVLSACSPSVTYNTQFLYFQF